MVSLLWTSALTTPLAAEGPSPSVGNPAIDQGDSQTEAPAQAPEPPPTFDILEYRVEGNTVLSRRQIELAVYPYLGPRRTIDDVQKARDALEKAYRDAGYATVYVDIPEQQVKHGIVRLTITEGKLSRVQVKGSRYYLLSRIREKLPALAPGAVLHMPQLQEQLAALNRTGADLQVTPVFRAGSTPGTVEVDLRVRDELPLHAAVEINNRYTQDTEKLRLLGSVRYDNLWQRGHSALLQYQTAPQDTDQVKVYSFNYVFRTNAARDVWAFYAVDSQSKVAPVGDITVLGAGNILGGRWIHSLRASAEFQDSLSFGLDIKDFDEDVQVGGAGIQTPIRYYPFSLGYTASRPYAQGTTGYGLSLLFSLRALSERTVDCGGLELDQFECKRSGAKPNFLYLRGEYQRTHAFKNNWGVTVRLEGQLASQPLVSNEQFAAGGMDSVRGYLESEVLGDEGVRASVELRTPSFGPAGALQDLHGVAFADGAALSLQNALPETPDQFNLASVGLGLRASAWKRLHSHLYWARALKEGASGDGGPVTDKGENRWHFRLEYAF